MEEVAIAEPFVNRPVSGYKEVVDVRLLGPVQVTVDGRGLELGGPKQRLVLALLTADTNRPVTVGRLIEALWDGETPADPRASLQVYVSNLRRALHDVDVEIDHEGSGYVLRTDPEHVDVNRFTRLVEQGLRLVRAEPQRAATVLRDALALHRGRPFGDLADVAELAADVARIEELHQRALEGRIAADLAVGNHEQIVAEVRQLTNEYPFRERLWEHLIVALYRSDRQSEALAAYDEARAILAEELGIDPSARLQELHSQVLRQDPALDVAAPTPGSRPGALRTVRGYDLMEEIGPGPLGTVYRALQTATGRDVAVEIVDGDHADDPRFVRNFDASVQRVARLEHPHLSELVDHWREPGGAYLVTAWSPGGTLAQALRRGRWDIDAVVGLIGQVAGALDHAHEHDLAHGAVSADSIRLGGNDNATVTGLAAAQLLRSLDPEGESEPAPTDDVRGLATIAYELLTGNRLPAVTVVASHASEHVPPPSTLRASIPPAVDPVLQRAITTPASHETAGDFAAALRTGATGRSADSTSPVRNPYKGLRAFDEADRADFFGRRELVANLVSHLGEPGPAARFLALVGPSGSGKSSVVRAGLVPALRQGAVEGSHDWFIATMVPGEWPVAELHRALVEIATCDPDEIDQALRGGPDGLVRAARMALPDDGCQLLLVIDQFEEIYSVARPRDREVFLDQLAGAIDDPGSPVRIVVTIRADFYDDPLLDPRLGHVIAQRTVPVTSLTVEQVERAITEPARRVDVGLEPRLVAAVVRDVSQNPGGLPMLQYAMTELFDRRHGRTLTYEAYETVGGVQGALGGQAEDLYSRLDPPDQELCRQIFLRLVTVGKRATDTRRRVLRTQLLGIGDSGSVERILERLGERRLLTFDRDHFTRAPTVEVAHEALTHAWGRLRGWIDAARDDIVMHRRLLTATDEWHAAGGDPSYLLQGSRLDEFAGWAQGSSIVLTDGERTYLDESLERRRHREAEKEARREHEAELERRASARLRVIVAVLAVAVVAAAVLATFALAQRNDARTERASAQRQQELAQKQERVATARGLASAAIAELTEDPERSLLLAIEAVETTRDADGSVLPEAETALHRALRASQVTATLPAGGNVGLSRSGDVAILGTDGTVSVWNRGSDQPSLEVAGYATSPFEFDGGDVALGTTESRMAGIDVSPDGHSIVVADADLRGTILDATTGQVRVRLEGQLVRPVFSPDGSQVAAVVMAPSRSTDPGRTVGLWDVETGQLIQLLEGHTQHVLSLAFSPDGSRVAATARTGLQGVTHIWDIASGERLQTIPGGEDAISFDPDGSLLAVNFGPQIWLHDATTGERIRRLYAHNAVVRSLAFSPDGTRIVSGGDDGGRVIEVNTGRVLHSLTGHRGTVSGVAFTPDGTEVVTTSVDGTTRTWDVRFHGGVDAATLPGPPEPGAGGIAVAPDGTELAAIGPDTFAIFQDRIPIPTTVRVWDLTTGEIVSLLEHEHPLLFSAMDYSPDGQTLATTTLASQDGRAPTGQVHLWDTTAGEITATFIGHAGTVQALDFSPDGRLLASGSDDGTARVWDLHTGDSRLVHRNDAGVVSDVAFTAEGGRLVTAGEGGVQVIDVDDGQVIHHLGANGTTIDEFTLTDNGDIITGELNGDVRRWSLDTGNTVETISRQVQAVRGLATHEGLLATSAADVITVRDLEDGQVRFELTGHRQVVWSLDFSPDGRFLVSTGRDGTIRVYAIPLEDTIELANERLTRTLTQQECDQFLQNLKCT